MSSDTGTTERVLERAGYAARQAARIAWYSGHYFAGRAFFGAMRASTYEHKVPAVDRAYLGARFRKVFEDDQRSIAEGEYQAPGGAASPLALGRAVSASYDYFRDARRVAERRVRNGHSDVLSEAARARYPRYFLQNFHFQSDGWLSAESARRYDMQVETLFTGSADVMRRRALPAIRRAIAGRDPQSVRLVDLGCGTGTFLDAVTTTWPGLDATALDLSPAYLGVARARLGARRRMAFRQAAAEATELARGSFDIATSVYLFHELPPPIRKAVAAEIARILRPGGVYIHVDTLQYGDDEQLDPLLRAFPHVVHEPYYDSYCRLDLRALFAAEGLAAQGDDNLAFLSKISVFQKIQQAATC